MPPPARPAPPRHGESGVALLIVLVVLFIVAVLMVDISLTAATARRSAANASGEFLMDAAIAAHFQVAAAQILYDQAENKFDSLDDRWAREEYTRFESRPPEEPDLYGGAVSRRGREEEDGTRVLGDSADVSVTMRIEDEERKFNLYLLLHPDPKKRADARERFAVLIDRFREETPLDISRTRADELRDRVVEYLERAAPVEGERGKIPVPRSGAWRILTPDELRNVEGFEDREHGMGADGILYDAREPEAVRTWMENPESEDAPEVYPGLLRFVTLWSGTTWVGQPTADSWLRVNVNTAEKPVLETLFFRNPGDMIFADRILEYRGKEKEGTGEGSSATASGEESPLVRHTPFESLEDLKKVDGLDDAVLQRNGIDATTATVTSQTFSFDFLAEHEKSTRQVRYVVRRHSKGVQTLLREERADPRFEEKPED